MSQKSLTHFLSHPKTSERILKNPRTLYRACKPQEGVLWSFSIVNAILWYDKTSCIWRFPLLAFEYNRSHNAYLNTVKLVSLHTQIKIIARNMVGMLRYAIKFCSAYKPLKTKEQCKIELIQEDLKRCVNWNKGLLTTLIEALEAPYEQQDVILRVSVLTCTYVCRKYFTCSRKKRKSFRNGRLRLWSTYMVL